ncbi:hypothetical protein JRQ81_004473 [Phrynocephalus forsythii]|uniref:Uncharacterized protein n=1 Tax=Phrynocephalus forsythii TaxID=171643 RepID=A0A9Q1AV86_9SAUR|nr:hypothetical protein JRQ81_004473 [Phrynocephalus forsythii]
MAERNISRALASSIHSEDLLSDMELLPASEPTTPGRRIPCSQPATSYTSNVTAQLYSSLHQSRQAEAEARSHLENHQSLALAEEAKATDIDLDVLAEELSHRLSTGVETSSYRKGSNGAAVAESHPITEMESVRCHLQGILRGSRDAAHGDAVPLGNFERKDDDSFESDSTTALLKTDAKGIGNLQARRNPDLKLPEVLRKEGASARRSGTSGTGREKPQPSAKAGKKPSATPAPNPRSSRGGSVWR